MMTQLPPGWLEATLIPENKSYKVDGSCRTVIPAHLATKMSVAIGDYMDYYTAYIDGKWFLCMTKNEVQPDKKKK